MTVAVAFAYCFALLCFRFHDPERRKDEVNKFGRILFK